MSEGGSRDGLIASVSEKIIRVLPPAFLMLALLNIGFLGATMYVVTHNAEARNQMLARILDNCLDRDHRSP
jgi:hypothetical protein